MGNGGGGGVERGGEGNEMAAACSHFSIHVYSHIPPMKQQSVELPATTLASCCVRVIGLMRRASTMAAAILLAHLSSP